MTNSKPARSLRARIVLVLIVLIALTAIGASCSKKGGLFNPTPLDFDQPAHFPQPVYSCKDNPLTIEGFELGRKLFYDPLLSKNNTISCGSCHIQGSAFTHHGHDLSHGIEDRLGTRNSPPIMNLAWSKSFFWDGGVFHLDLQPIAPIENPVEMDESMESVIRKLNNNAVYPSLFRKAFGTDQIDGRLMLKALSQFMVQCVSANSRYDKVKLNKGEKFTELEKQGQKLYETNCASCHAGELFTDNEFHSNGLVPSLLNDSGRFRITLNPSDMYLFKTPSLRNIAKTAPYMHDGRFLTLEAVLDHYDHGVVQSNTLDSRLNKNGVLGIKLSTQERQALLAFLQTLTDETFTRDPKLAEQ